jgi:indole-3-glycerol phosphate synthase
VGMFQDEVAASQGIRIRRRPWTGPPLHYVGPFEFRLQNEGNTPRNILEEIIWHKDKEVAKVIFTTWFVKYMFCFSLYLFPFLVF